jgi:Domain of unknown function (DUF4326)
MTTKVINLHNEKPPGYVYIGMKDRFHPDKYPQTKWGNPYHRYIKKWGREKVIKRYVEHLMSKPDLLKQIPIELKDKTLGCWCHPEKCHGHVLAELADRL